MTTPDTRPDHQYGPLAGLAQAAAIAAALSGPVAGASAALTYGAGPAGIAAVTVTAQLLGLAAAAGILRAADRHRVGPATHGAEYTSLSASAA